MHAKGAQWQFVDSALEETKKRNFVEAANRQRGWAQWRLSVIISYALRATPLLMKEKTIA